MILIYLLFLLGLGGESAAHVIMNLVAFLTTVSPLDLLLDLGELVTEEA